MRYPDAARKFHIQGQVILETVIEKDGSLDHVRIVKSMGYENGMSADFNKEAIRVVMSSPKWRPAIYHDEPARVMWAFTINFGTDTDD